MNFIGLNSCLSFSSSVAILLLQTLARGLSTTEAGLIPLPPPRGPLDELFALLPKEGHTWCPNQPYCSVSRESQSAATRLSQLPSSPSAALGPRTRRAGPAKPAQPFQNSHSGLPSGPLPSPVGRVSAKAEVRLEDSLICFRKSNNLKLLLYQKVTNHFLKGLKIHRLFFFSQRNSLKILLSD